MKLGINAGTLAKAVNGSLVKGDASKSFDSFVTDTRLLRSGEFFWALKGASHDAHDFLPQAAACAGGFLVREDAIEGLKDLPPVVITVKDTLKALQDLAAWHRARFNLHLTAITGSNGKSTVKEMLKSIFSAAGSTCSNPGNFNNQFGLPLSLLEIGAEHRYGVFELGASRKGDIEEIAVLAKPACGVITNIGPSHLEFFGDLETVFETKTELAGALAAGGTLVYNYDDRYLSRLNGRDMKKITFGRDPEADVRILEGVNLRLEYGGDTIEIRMPGGACAHNRENAAAAFAAALAAGLELKHIRKGLENYSPPPMRLQELKIGGATLVLDAYNSNPASAASAIKHAVGMDKPLYIMLGDMKELGRHSEYYHRDLGCALAHTGAEKVFLAGPEMKAAAEGYLHAGGQALVYGETLDDWLTEARKLIASGRGTFLIKASRSMRFERIVEGL